VDRSSASLGLAPTTSSWTHSIAERQATTALDINTQIPAFKPHRPPGIGPIGVGLGVFPVAGYERVVAFEASEATEAFQG
jgi:hypothetical protein